MNICNIENTFKLKTERKWDTIYVLLDIHGTIIPSSNHVDNRLEFISEDAIEVLQWFTKRSDIRIILWTASYPNEIVQVIEWLEKYKITIDFVNHNPECKNTAYANFSMKPYFNMLIDDKAGFCPETDWIKIKKTLVKLGEWEK